jgi:hypothetical protein
VLSTEHSLQPSADARAILTPKDVKLCCMFSSFIGRVSRDYFICLSVIINYDFDLSVFIFPKSGVKIGQFVIIRHVIKYFFYSLECASCKVRNLSNCTARKSAKFCREKKSGKYIYASRSYRGLELYTHPPTLYLACKYVKGRGQRIL